MDEELALEDTVGREAEALGQPQAGAGGAHLRQQHRAQQAQLAPQVGERVQVEALGGLHRGVGGGGQRGVPHGHS